MNPSSRRPVRLGLDSLEARDVPVNVMVTAASGFGGVPKNVIEYNPNGGIVSNRIIPPNPATGEVFARDIDITASGRLVVFNGTDPATVSIFNGTGWNHVTLPGLSSMADASFGGLTTAGRYVFAPDMTSAGPGEPNGIVRIDLTNLQATRFLPDAEYFDLTVGLDGM